MSRTRPRFKDTLTVDLVRGLSMAATVRVYSAGVAACLCQKSAHPRSTGGEGMSGTECARVLKTIKRRKECDRWVNSPRWFYFSLPFLGVDK